jgi:hypothetical protein
MLLNLRDRAESHTDPEPTTGPGVRRAAQGRPLPAGVREALRGLTSPGPCWDAAELAAKARDRNADADAELAEIEARLAEADGDRVRVQRLACEQLVADGLDASRLNVARRAVALLTDPGRGGQAC